MFDKLFSGMSRMGEKKVRVKFKLLIKDINFQTNNYFMKNSTYSIFQVKNHKRKIKSKKNLFTISDLKHIPLGEVIKFYATLYKNDGDRYSPKTRRLIIRQNNVVDCEDVYKDIGYIDLPLDRIVNGTQELDCKLQVSDSDKMLKAHMNIAIRFKIKREGEKEDDEDGVEGWEENEAEYSGKGSSQPGLKKQKSKVGLTVRMDLSESKVSSSDIADDDNDSVDSRYVPPSSGADEPLDRYVPEPTISSRGSASGGGSIVREREGSVIASVRGGSVVASVRGGDSVGSGNTKDSPNNGNSSPRLAPSSGNSVEFRQPILEEWQVEQERQLVLLQQRQQFGRPGNTYDMSPGLPPNSQSFYAPVQPPPAMASQSFYVPNHTPPPAASQSFYVAAQNQQAQLEQAYSQNGRSMHNMQRDPYGTPQSSGGSVHSNHSNESPSYYPQPPSLHLQPRVSQPVSPAYTSPFQSQHMALQQVQHAAQTEYVNNSRRSQYGQFDVGIAAQSPSQYVPPIVASSNASIFQQQLQQQQQYEQQRQQQQLQRQPANRGTGSAGYNQQYSPPNASTDYSYDRQSSYEQQQEPYGAYGGYDSSQQQQQHSGGGYDDQLQSHHGGGGGSQYGFPQQYAPQFSSNNSRQSSASVNSRQSSGQQQQQQQQQVSPPNSSRGGGGGDYLTQLNRSNSSSNVVGGNRVRFDDSSIGGMSRGSGGGGGSSHYSSQNQQGMY